MTADWCATTPLAIALTHTCGRSPKCELWMTRIGGRVVYGVIPAKRPHDSVLQNIWIRTCDLWNRVNQILKYASVCKGQFGEGGQLQSSVLLTLAHWKSFGDFGLPLASLTSTLFNRRIKTFWAVVSQYTVVIISSGESVSASSDIQITVRALRRSTYTQTDNLSRALRYL